MKKVFLSSILFFSFFILHFSFFFVFLHHESIWTDNIGYDCIDGGADD